MSFIVVQKLWGRWGFEGGEKWRRTSWKNCRMPSSTGSSVPSSSLISVTAISIRQANYLYFFIITYTIYDIYIYICMYAASAGASATMTSLNAEAPRNRLLELVSRFGLAVEKDEMLRGVSLSAYDLGTSVASRYGGIPATRTAAVDFGKQKAHQRVFQSMRHAIFQSARCAGFSPDGKFVATGSSNTSIKLFVVSKIKQMMLPEARDGPVRPVIHTFYDHLKTGLDFHPHNTVLISVPKDQTIKFFDFYKMTAKRAFRASRMHTRCVQYVFILLEIFFLLCYLSANAPEIDVNGAINQVFGYSGKHVTASKDGVIRLWDDITAKCARSIPAHGTAEATSENFTKDQRFVLSSGKDSTVKLWEVGTGKLIKQYLGATHTQLRCQAVFNDTEKNLYCPSTNQPMRLLSGMLRQQTKWQSGLPIILVLSVGLRTCQRRQHLLPVGLTDQSGSGRKVCQACRNPAGDFLDVKSVD
ncbi:hypothetical protein DVH24_023693 [Malus domestica]|uniref:Cleavage stimulation factor 50 kDa subunit n=1 Tax=Malus domestica TaxID=3750 RepID=A0A498I3E4_MALDO|nr:hypothetical protein DVH24_023693 [Malus domestica]